jgi:hypothetical protein
MNKNLTRIAFGIATLTATSAFSQGLGYGPGSGYGPCGAGGPNCPWAQGAPRGAAPATPSVDPVDVRLERMAARLNLTADQKARIEPILRERQALRLAQQQAMREQMARILTPDQLAQFDQMRAQGGMGRGGGPRCGGWRGFGPGAGYGYGPGTGPGGWPPVPGPDLLGDGE